MIQNNVSKLTDNDNDVLFGVPDTGVSVSWDFSAGCATNEKKGTYLKPVTPKQTKFSSSTSRVYRRRCLTNQIKLPTDGDAAFAEQMLSLVSVNRKSIIKNSPGVSSVGRSPRGLRSKMSKASPLRDDNFLSLLNDSMENDDMIRCSQITEAALKEKETKSPIVAKKEARMSFRLAAKNVGNPSTRKRLSDVISSNQKVSPLRQSNNLSPETSSTKVVTEVETAKSTDQCNNNVESALGMVEDDLFLNFADDFSRSEKSELRKKSPRLSLNQKRQQSVPGVTPIVRVDTNNLADPSKTAHTDTCNKNGPIVDVGAPSEALDDDMDFDLELSPHLLDLLDGRSNGSKGQPSKESVPSRTAEAVVQPRLSIPRSHPLQIQPNAEPLKSSVARGHPLQIQANADPLKSSVPRSHPLQIQANAKPLKSSVPRSHPVQIQANAEPLKSSVPRSHPLQIQANAEPLKSSVPRSHPLQIQANADPLKSSVPRGHPLQIQANAEPLKNSVPRSHPVQIQANADPLKSSVPRSHPLQIQSNAEPLKSSVPTTVPKQVPTTAKQSSATSSYVPAKLPGVTLSQSVQPTVEKPALVSKGLTRHASAPGLGRSSLPASKPSLPPVQNKAPVKKCTREEIERKRQEALKKLKKSQSK